MDPITLGLIGGTGFGLVKSLFDAGNEARQRKVAAETNRYSPWTGMQGQMPKPTDWLGNMFSGGLTGATFAQGLPKGGGDAGTGFFSKAIADSKNAANLSGLAPAVASGPAMSPWEKLLNNNPLSGGVAQSKYSLW